MPYIIRITNKAEETVYFHTSRCTVYCPELATKYNSRKNASSMKSYLLKQKEYQNLEIVEYSPELVTNAHQTHRNKGEDFVDNILGNIEKS